MIHFHGKKVKCILATLVSFLKQLHVHRKLIVAQIEGSCQTLNSFFLIVDLYIFKHTNLGAYCFVNDCTSPL